MSGRKLGVCDVGRQLWSLPRHRNADWRGRNEEFLSPQDSELVKTFVNDGKSTPPDLDGFWSTRDTRVFFNAQSLPQVAPMSVGVLVESGLPSAQLDDRGGDPLVQKGEVLRKLREQLSPQRNVGFRSLQE